MMKNPECGSPLSEYIGHINIPVRAPFSKAVISSTHAQMINHTQCRGRPFVHAQCRYSFVTPTHCGIPKLHVTIAII